jgi:hypothetical protein
VQHLLIFRGGILQNYTWRIQRVQQQRFSPLFLQSLQWQHHLRGVSPLASILHQLANPTQLQLQPPLLLLPLESSVLEHPFHLETERLLIVQRLRQLPPLYRQQQPYIQQQQYGSQWQQGYQNQPSQGNLQQQQPQQQAQPSQKIWYGLFKLNRCGQQPLRS